MQLNPPQQSPSTSLSTESFLVQQPPPTLPFPPKNHLSTCLLVSCKMQVGLPTHNYSVSIFWTLKSFVFDILSESQKGD